MKRQGFAALVATASALGCASDSAREPDAGEDALLLVDTVVLAEREPAYIGRPSGFVVAGDGSFLVADATNHVVHHYSARGEYLGAFGRRGSGPGELAAPTTIALDGDSLLLVLARLRMHAFTFPGREYRWTIPVPAMTQAVVARDGRIFINGVDRSSRSTLRYRESHDGRWLSGGPFPEPLGRSRAVDQLMTWMAFAIEGDSILLAIQPSDYLFMARLGEARYDSVPIPFVRRRGARRDLIDLVRDEDPASVRAAAYESSAPWALEHLPSGMIAHAVLDYTPETDPAGNVSRFTARAFVSVIDPASGRVCPDAAIDAPVDPPPLIDLHGDTAAVLVQQVTPDDRAVTLVKRFAIVADRCTWIESGVPALPGR